MPLLGMRKRLQIGQKGTIGHNIANDEVIQTLEGVQGQVGVPQVPFLGHVDEMETPNWTIELDIANGEVNVLQVSGPLGHKN